MVWAGPRGLSSGRTLGPSPGSELSPHWARGRPAWFPGRRQRVGSEPSRTSRTLRARLPKPLPAAQLTPCLGSTSAASADAQVRPGTVLWGSAGGRRGGAHSFPSPQYEFTVQPPASPGLQRKPRKQGTAETAALFKWRHPAFPGVLG